MNASWVAGQIETSRRREVLSWGHHAEVAALPPAQQEKLLNEAEENGWSTWPTNRPKLSLGIRYERKRVNSFVRPSVNSAIEVREPGNPVLTGN